VIQTKRWLGFLAIGGVLLASSGCGLLSWSEPAPSHHVSSRPRPIAKPVSAPTQYTVEKGDTLYSIAFRNQLDYHDLANWNDIGRDYRIQLGQRLRLTPPPGLELPGAIGSAGTVSSAPVILPTPPATGRKPSPGLPAATASTPTATPLPASGIDSDTAVAAWQWPTQGDVVDRFDPDGGQKGIDISGAIGQIVVASAPGKVVYSGSALKGYGELVIVKHNETYLSAYGYNRKRLVEEGQQVSAGQALAELGTGPQQKPVLHFEIRAKGRPIDPLPMLPRR
jgi:lipoprotein NlpD